TSHVTPEQRDPEDHSRLISASAHKGKQRNHHGAITDGPVMFFTLNGCALHQLPQRADQCVESLIDL
ncbi:hypothetical protein, partial [Aeromonas veronii]|uniref:hypothetical protein n=1 Tax=Aeromonas veronii TaxID=654 RepID=UPI0038B5F2CB